MTNNQILAVLHHLFDHDKSMRFWHEYNDAYDNTWRHAGMGKPPKWLGETFGFWLTAFRAENWTELAQWLPPDKMGPYANIKNRNRELAKAVETRELYLAYKRKHKCTKTDAVAAIAAKLHIKDNDTVDDRLTNLKNWERQSNKFWSDLFRNSR